MRKIFNNKRVIFLINISTVLIALLTCSIVYSSKAKTSTSLKYKKSLDEQSYIIELKGNSAIDQVKNLNNASKMLDFEQNILKKQSSIISEIENITGNKISNQTGILLNTISIMATCEEIERIKCLNEVIDIQKNVVYESADTKTKQNYTIDEYKDILKVREDATGLSAIRSDSTINHSGKGTIIAIIDSGVNYNHKDMVLDTNFEPKYSKEQWEEKINLLGYGSYISDKIPFAYNYADKNEDVLDSNNTHGYHVSGIASSNGDLMGVAPNSQVVALKFLGKDGQGDTSNLINALEDAVVLGVDVINMSIGSPYGMESKDSIQEKAIKKAADKGILCCAATGNIATTDGLYDFSNKFKLIDTSTVNTPAVVKDTLAVASSNIFMYRKHITTEMSKFSSWGPTNELTIKPEITAPGENILSTLDGTNGYSTQSGTSMASPYISGMASLVLNEVKNKNICSFYNKNQLLQGRELFAFIKNNLMNTAEPIIENEYHNKTYNLPYSVRLQGAGLANVYAAVNNRVIATYNGEAKIELGEVEDSTAFDIILTNYGDKNITYTIKNCEIYQPLTTLDGKYYTDKSALAKIKVADTITVPAYGQAKISCSLEIQDGYLENSFVESYIRFTSDLEDVPNLSMPLLAFYGDWNNEPIIDKSIYDEGLSYLEEKNVVNMLTRKPLTSNTCLLSNKINYTDNKEVTNEVILGTSAANITDYNGGVVAFSPNNDKNMDEVYAGVTQLRNGYHIKLHILDSNFNKIRELGSASLLARSSYLELCKSSCKRLVSSNLNNINDLAWDGTIFDNKANKYKKAADGQYYIQIESQISNNSSPQVVTMPIKIDTEKPKLIYSKFENGIYTYQIADNTAIDNSVYVIVDGKVQVYEQSKLPNDSNGNYIIEMNNANHYESIKVLHSDVAGNEIENVLN